MRCRGGSALLERAVPVPVSAQTSLFVAFVYSRVDIGQSLRLNACRLSCAKRTKARQGAGFLQRLGTSEWTRLQGVDGREQM